jgi:hypothetical protein
LAKDQQRGADRADDVVAQRPEREVPALVGYGIGGGQPAADHVHLVARLVQRGAGGEASVGDEAAPAAMLFRRGIDVQGRPDLHVLQLGHLGCRRQHADDGEAAVVQRDIAADDLRVGAELTLPEAVAEHGDVVTAQLLVFRREEAAEVRAEGQRLEKTRRGDAAGQPFASVFYLQDESPTATHTERLEGLALA